ncbi:hypothetical protein L2E82_11347 [Cichorium intybus]|uniref:Uncharacterized protein n=1 Tax=Cichorium intybus TaxID=13427 RepID=A0ACB9GD33_CICIN|nr:hypothetical protein L2E82_11347 [Cichorium intybus]
MNFIHDKDKCFRAHIKEELHHLTEGISEEENEEKEERRWGGRSQETNITVILVAHFFDWSSFVDYLFLISVSPKFYSVESLLKG